jgi:lactoylglutathione lyase
MSHIGLCVSDLDRSVEFYTKALGAQEFNAIEMTGFINPGYQEILMEIPEHLDVTSKFIGLDYLLIELLYYKRNGEAGGHVGPSARRQMNQLGYTHLGLRISDPEEYERIQELVEQFGGTVLRDTRFTCTVFAGEKVESMYVTDPDGTRLELMRIPLSMPAGDVRVIPGRLERIEESPRQSIVESAG